MKINSETKNKFTLTYRLNFKKKQIKLSLKTNMKSFKLLNKRSIMKKLKFFQII